MKKLAQFSLRIKIAIFIFIGTVLFSSLILYLTYRYVNETLTESLIDQGRIVAANIAELAAEKIIIEDMVELKAIIEKYTKDRFEKPLLWLTPMSRLELLLRIAGAVTLILLKQLKSQQKCVISATRHRYEIRNYVYR